MADKQKPAWQKSAEAIEQSRSKDGDSSISNPTAVPPAPGAGSKGCLWITVVFFLGAMSLLAIQLSNYGSPFDSGLSSTPSAKPRLKPGPVTAGRALCNRLTATGMTAGCEVKGWGETVDLRIDTTSAEAREICVGVAEMMVGRGFAGFNWKLRILSPYSGDQPIAVCNLR